MLAITSITTFLGGLWAFCLPLAYTLQFLGRMVLYLQIFFSLSQHYYITLSRIQQYLPLRNKNLCGTQFHTLVLYFFKKLPTIGTSIITKHVKLPSLDSEVIPHRIRHGLARLKLPNLRQRQVPSSSSCHGEHTDMVFIWQALWNFQKIEYPPTSSPKQPHHKALPVNPINFPISDYKALITYNRDKVRGEKNCYSSWQISNHRSSSEIQTSHLTHNYKT